MGTFFEFQRLLRIAAAGWWNDRAMSLGASISFFTVFSLAPMLLAAISVAGLAFGHDAAKEPWWASSGAFWARRLPKRSKR